MTGGFAWLSRCRSSASEPAIQQLQNNSAALDVYVWLCYRLHVLQAPTPISWGRLKEQFGQQYATTFVGTALVRAVFSLDRALAIVAAFEHLI